MHPHNGKPWAEVTQGEALPPLAFPVSYGTLAKDVAGTRDPYPIHHDPDFAKGNGARDIFLNTMWYQGLVGRFVNEWGGPQSFVRKLGLSMRAHGCPGDVLTCHGTVTALRAGENGLGLVDIEVRIDNQGKDGELREGAVLATVTLELP